VDFEDYEQDEYEQQALDVAVDLANSLDVVSGEDYLTDAGAVSAWLEQRGIHDSGPPSEADVNALRRLRERVRLVMEGSDQDAERALDQLVDSAAVRPRLNLGPEAWRLSYVTGKAGIVNRVAAIAVAGLAAALAESGRDRFGICSKDGCRDVYVDTSKNRSRRYCSDSCSNRANVAAFRARQKKH
jgi:predicted RNA-binding Zn ribbon-like protein